LECQESNSTKEHESKEQEPHTLILRRSVRETRKLEPYTPPYFHFGFALSITDDDPRTVRNTMDSEDGKIWKKALVKEMASLDKNEAWDLVEFLAGRKLICSKWVFNKNLNEKGKVEKYKHHQVAKNPAYHSKTKHINIQYHFVRDMVEDKKVILVKVDTLKNIVDPLTNFVSTKNLSWCKEEMGIATLNH
jgi:hypothetical protein